jgi:hypothetical protein
MGFGLRGAWFFCAGKNMARYNFIENDWPYLPTSEHSGYAQHQEQEQQSWPNNPH